jgi:GT2 family glycosyltransferase
VTWNGLSWLKSFLPSVVSHTSRDAEIIIADNASDDGTADWVKVHFPDVIVARFDQNYGYCGGNNKAAEQATGDILLFLNNDVEVSEGWLEPVVESFQSNAMLGAAQPKIRSHKEPDRFEYAGAAGGMLDAFGYPFCLGRIFDTCEIDTGQYDDVSKNIFWASGAAFAVRKNLFVEAGGFDEDFRFHMEEIDLCWKIKRMGYTIACVPKSIVYHVGGGSLDASSAKKLAYNARNNLTMLYKHLPMPRFMAVFIARIFLDAIAAIRELLKGKFAHFWALVTAQDFFILHIGSAHRKRKELLNRNLPFHTGDLSPILLPWQYFVLKRKTFRQLPTGTNSI